jgi:hypothetical protein
MAPKKDNLTVAREFFNRRRSGLDRKAQTLITHESKKHHVDVKVTIVYEYQNEVSFFRSHPTEVGARWFSSFNELVSVVSIQSILSILMSVRKPQVEEGPTPTWAPWTNPRLIFSNGRTDKAGDLQPTHRKLRLR